MFWFFFCIMYRYSYSMSTGELIHLYCFYIDRIFVSAVTAVDVECLTCRKM